jgi:phosphate transport system permease protein
MTDLPADMLTGRAESILVPSRLMTRRNAAERRFRIYGIFAIGVSLAVLAIMLFTIFADGISSFRQTSVTFPVLLDAERLDPDGNRDHRLWQGDRSGLHQSSDQ